MHAVACLYLMSDVCSLVRANQPNSRQFDNTTQRNERTVPRVASEPQIPQSKVVPGASGKQNVQKRTPRKVEGKSKERAEARPESEEHANAEGHARRSKL